MWWKLKFFFDQNIHRNYRINQNNRYDFKKLELQIVPIFSLVKRKETRKSTIKVSSDLVKVTYSKYKICPIYNIFGMKVNKTNPFLT